MNAIKEIQKRYEILVKLDAAMTTLKTKVHSMPEDSSGRELGIRVIEIGLRKSESLLEEMKLYASFAGEVPESVLRDRLK
jgi:hypothetical protein